MITLKQMYQWSLILYVFYVFFMVSVCNSCQIAPTQADLARGDIEFITKTLIQNHPGVHNVQDPHFMDTLNSAHEEALGHVEQVETTDQHIALLRRYANAFNDSHLRIWSKNLSMQQVSTTIPVKEFSIKSVTDTVALITIPTFGPNQKEQEQLNSIIAHLPEYRSHECIIFDVRGNGGGSSCWGKNIVKALFGNDYVEQKSKNLHSNVYVDWRASNDNTEYVGTLIDRMAQQFGIQSEAYAWVVSTHQGMKKAHEAGDVYFHQARTEEHSTILEISPENLCRATIIVLIDHSCVSACLDFIDNLKALDNPVVLIGETTSADSVYMEVRSIELPSGLGRLAYPIKVYRNRRRGHNQPYQPDIIYKGDLDDIQVITKLLSDG